MHRIVVNVQTGVVTQVELTAEEVAAAEAQYQAWLAEQPVPEEQPESVPEEPQPE